MTFSTAPEEATGPPFVAERLQQAYGLLDAAIGQRVIPGAVALIGLDDGWLPPHVTGLAVDTPRNRLPMREDTVFDLASLTKVVATLPALLHLAQTGVADLQSPVVSSLQEWDGDESRGGITPLHLLTHTSGLPAWRDLHSHGWRPDEILREVLSAPLDAPPGTRMVYSDLGFILLGEWVRRVTGRTLDEWTHTHLYGPLGMVDTCFCPPADRRERIAAGEYREHLGRHQWGEVNDDNAYALGGVSGHAGLFSTVQDLSRYVDACWLSWRPDPNGPLAPAVVSAALRDYTASLGAHRGLGWTLKGDVWDPSGQLMSPSTFGHTGYTGTSIVIDPERGLKVILLTNRVHTSLAPGIVSLRRRFHNVAAAACPAT